MTIMTKLTRRHVLAFMAATAAMPLPASAAQRRYALDARNSTVAFRFNASGLRLRGTMPVAQADIRIDPQALAQSRVDVSVDATRVRSKAAYALPAMKSADILDVARHPRIRFQSRSVRLGAGGRISEGAQITGDLTIRGVTRQVTLNANLYRQSGNAASDLSQLSVRLTGRISRAAFGMTGYRGLVEDAIELDIIARISAA